MEKHFKIGEISKLFGIGTDSLRYYEKIGVIHPVRGDNKYRLYKVNDIWRLNVIRDLRRLGFSMEQIKEYLNKRSISATMELLKREQEAIDAQIASLQQQRLNVSRRLETMVQARGAVEGEITITEYSSRYCYEIQEGYQSDEEMDVLIQRLLRKDQNRLYIIGNNRIGSRIDLKKATEGSCRSYKTVFFIDENGDTLIPCGTYLSLCFRGSSDKAHQYVPKLLDYAKQHKLQPTGDILELLLVDIHEAENIEEHTTQLQVRVEKR